MYQSHFVEIIRLSQKKVNLVTLSFGDMTGFKIALPVCEGELQIGSPGATFLLSDFVFTPHFLQIVVEVKASGPSHVLKLWMEVSKGMLSVQYLLKKMFSLATVKC